MSKYRKGAILPIVVILIVLGIGVVGFLVTRSPSLLQKNGTVTHSTLSPTPPNADPSTSADLPPLYPGVEWEEAVKGEFVFVDKNGEIVESNGTKIESKDFVSEPITSSFITYYKSELKRSHWIESDYASGPNGEVYSFTKGSKFTTVGYKPASNKKYSLYIEYN